MRWKFNGNYFELEPQGIGGHDSGNDFYVDPMIEYPNSVILYHLKDEKGISRISVQIDTKRGLSIHRKLT